MILSPWGRLGDEITTIVAASAIRKIRKIEFEEIRWTLWYQDRLQSKPLNICEGQPFKLNWRYAVRIFDSKKDFGIEKNRLIFRILIAICIRLERFKRFLTKTEFFSNETIKLPIRSRDSSRVEINVSVLEIELALLGVTNLPQVSLRNPNKQDQIYLEKVKNPKTICLHIRRGDTVGDSKRGVLDAHYWLSALYTVAQGKPLRDFSLLIFTDDHQGALRTIENFSNEFNQVELTPFLDEPARDFVLMANASNLLIANSAFSRWAGVFNSIHNKGKVVSPSKINLIQEEWGLKEWEYVQATWN